MVELSYTNQDLGEVLGEYRQQVSKSYNKVTDQSVKLRDLGGGNWIFGSNVVRSVSKNAGCPENVDLWEYRQGEKWTSSVFVKVQCGE